MDNADRHILREGEGLKMEFEKYQEEAMKTKFKNAPIPQILEASLGLAGEVGEFVELIKKFYVGGFPLDSEKVVEELGDILWYVTLAIDGLAGSLDFVAEKNIEKLRTRYKEGFTLEESVSRVDYEKLSKQ